MSRKTLPGLTAAIKEKLIQQGLEPIALPM
jgi:hypothetical protein